MLPVSVAALLAVAVLSPMAFGRPEPQRQPNFDPTKYVGRWYEIARTKNMGLFERGTDNQANYGLFPNGTVSVVNYEWRNDHWSNISGIATVVDNARLAVDFYMGRPGDYQVLETDYVSYAVVYSQSSIGPLTIEAGWILARQATVPQAVIDHAFQVYASNTGLKPSSFHITKQGVAPYPPKSQIKVSRDDRNPPRQPNFDANRYLGKWYEIARSKNMPFEFGTDNEANYALNANGTIAVRNLEWRTDQWSVAHAVATIVDNARLTVDFFMGPPGDYQVLETDYDTYAIVYSDALNFGPFKIRYGWILAREATVSQEVIDHAFSVFEKYTSLKRDSFHMTAHGVAPVPPPTARQAVRRDVPLQPDFNLNAYTGKWYEIYRTKNIPFESGTDINALYTANADGTVGVTNKEWLPEKNQWKEANGVATYVSNARLKVKFGRFQPAGDYRVLYTDYENVAVVYSEFWFIKYGWVLSRVPSLTVEQDAKVFEVFEKATGLTRSKFAPTEHGVAPKN